MAMNLKLMGNALARHKEQKAAAFLKSLGTSLFDNSKPAESLFGTLSGRKEDLDPNGSMTMDDLMKGMAHMSEEGFAPDVLLMHPLFYLHRLAGP